MFVGRTESAIVILVIITIFASCNSYRRCSVFRTLNRLKIPTRMSVVETDLNREVDPVMAFFKEIQSREICEPQNVISTINVAGKKMLSNISVPKIKDEAWKFTNIRKLFAPLPSANSWKLPTITNLNVGSNMDASSLPSLVFTDGIYNEDLSTISLFDPSISVQFLTKESNISNELMEELCFIPQKNYLPRDSFGSDILTAINMAYLEEIVHIKIPDGTVMKRPIQLIFFSSLSSSEETMKSSFPKLFFDVGRGSSISVLENHIPLSCLGDVESPISASNFVCQNIRFNIQADASVFHTQLQNLSTSARHTSVISAEVGSNSRYDLRLLQSGAMQSRVNVHVNLTGSLSNCTLNGAVLSGQGQVLDLHSSIIHNAPETYSDQRHHVLLGEGGRGVFKGHIRIPSHGQKSEANQQCRTIILGERARIQAIPTLEISANDVACSHGAAIADVDENALFFLSSRGIGYQNARKILTKSFILSLLQDAGLSDGILEKVTDRILYLAPATAVKRIGIQR